MKKAFIKTTAASLLLFSSVFANAQSAKSDVYAELGWTSITYKEPGYSLNPGMLRGIVGMDVHPNLAVEGMLALGVSDDTVNIRGVSVKFEAENSWGLYLKPKATVAPNLDVFARVGFAKTKIKASVPGYAVTDSGSDFSYGLGASYKFNESLSLNLDYMSYYDKRNVSGKGFTLGLGMRF